MSDTVYIGFVRRAIGWLGDNTALADRILRDADIDPARIDDPALRVPLTSFASVWRTVSLELEDEFFGLDSRRMKLGSFALVCRSISHDTLFETSLERCLQAFGLLLDNTRGTLCCNGDTAEIRIECDLPAVERRVHAIELFVTMVHGVMCWIAGRHVPLSHLALDYPGPAHANEYERMFSRSVSFSCSRTTASFDARWLKALVPQMSSRLDTFLRTMPESVIRKFEDETSLTLRIRRRLQAIDPIDWPDIGELSRQMHMSTSTLQRRLEAEGSSYSIEKAELRRDLAIGLLKRTQKPLRDIAFEVGYQELSTFCRAFRHWTGVAPSSYRRFRSARSNPLSTGRVSHQ